MTLTSKDLAEFAPLPGLPGYLVHPDGRVDVRVRDLTYAMFGRDSRWGW